MSSKVDTKHTRSTDRFDHYEFEGITLEDIDQSTIRTASAPNGTQVIFGRNTRTGKLDIIKMQVPKK